MPVNSCTGAKPRNVLAKLLLALGMFALVSGCQRNVKQDKHSGKDAKYKGAKKIKLDEDNEGRSRRDVVTYPGGDRTDWLKFKLAGEPDLEGTLRIKVKFQPPRPGLDLAFNVYDQYKHRIGRAKKSPESGKRTKTVKLKNARPGEYFVQIYAPRRTDAASYRVYVRYKEKEKEEVVAIIAGAETIPEPPKLPAIPEPEEPKDPVDEPPEDPVEPVPVAKPINARVVKYQLNSSGSLLVTLDKGKNAGVDKGWNGTILNRGGQPLEGGEFKIIQVTSRESVCKVRLSVDQIKANRKVKLFPPAPAQ
jgi:hypothetical protein